MLTLLPNSNLDHSVVIQYHSVLTELLRSFQNNQQLNHVTLNYNDDSLGYDPSTRKHFLRRTEFYLALAKQS